MGINLMEKIGVGTFLEISENNLSLEDSFSETRLQPYSIDQIDLSSHGGIGLYVEGDNSGATLVIRLSTIQHARDYAIPINFSGRKWIEVPNCEQGWRLRNWSWSAKTKKFCDFRKISEISIGLGYIPANTKANVSIEHLQALEEILEPIENATITVGDHSVALDSVINPYNHFTVHSEGNFTVYDENWNMLSVEFVGEFLPSDISDFLMESKTSSRKIWLEATVQVSNETKNSTSMDQESW